MAVTIDIVNRQKGLPLHPLRIRRSAKTTLKVLGVSSARLSVVLVTDGEIRKINRQYLRHDYATDVLSFDLAEAKRALLPWGVKTIEGEIIISTATARRQAKEFQSTPEQELDLYLIHGILHLAGYDDHGAEDTRRMRRKEAEVLGRLRLRRNRQ